MKSIEENVRAAHTFLSKHYGNASDSEIILVGFSRGALTARVLAALINDVGLLSEKGLRHHELIFTHWAARRQQWKDEPENDRLVVEAIRKRFAPDTFLFQDGRQIHIKAVAVWDTVQSLGWKQVFQNVLPWLATEGEEQRFAFVRNRLPSNVENAFQALALNEHRRNFQAVIWDAEGAASSLMKQCWFAGYHSDPA
ncbi:putative peptidoglycan binding domain containing protein [Phaeoacremonium minimum UCRPA7]|uniref:Putative peptidoglycan binding domain containing protein n=1 Tax=Phaeoacremonium minimum (strain UCR-PA7) TaxID=1286976 RepID=R8BEE9_PHAM7|nr:putative peptidoglycan binding domain containing protein [Phaeoacremonium minimum UCRPA7]EON97673.1 putative peptidoglycan binding domain containing protein [Phaeoacremonium minimum UCRPA7]